MKRGARPSALVSPGVDTSDVPVLSFAKMPSNTCSRSSLKS
jgi:hypothetical protein